MDHILPMRTIGFGKCFVILMTVEMLLAMIMMEVMVIAVSHDKQQKKNTCTRECCDEEEYEVEKVHPVQTRELEIYIQSTHCVKRSGQMYPNRVGRGVSNECLLAGEFQALRRDVLAHDR